jgi:hypothetical protein
LQNRNFGGDYLTMFVHLEVRKRRSGERLFASLLRSVRVDGRPRHQYVAYVGSIDARWLSPPAASERLSFNWTIYRGQFWENAAAALDRCEVGADQRAKIEARLERHVPRPAAAAFEAAIQDRDMFMRADGLR